MAPARRKRENQYFDAGKEGRKTGLTVAEQPKDKYGLESIENVFSSPRKSSTLHDGSNANLSSKEMDMSRGSGVDPTVILNERRVLNSTKSHLAPPSSRSPRKTNIGSSPRRHSSIGPSARQSRSSIGPPIRANGVRKLDFNQELRPVESHRVSPLRANLRRGAQQSTSKDVYDLRESPETEQLVDVYEHTEEEGQERADDSIAVLDDGPDSISDNESAVMPDLDVEEPMVPDDADINALDNDIPILDMDEDGLEELEEPISSPMVQKKKRAQPNSGRRKSDQSESTKNPSQHSEQDMSSSLATNKYGRARSTQNVTASASDQDLETASRSKTSQKSKSDRVSSSARSSQQTKEHSQDGVMAPPPKRKGRPRKRKAEDGETEGGDSINAAKRPRQASQNQPPKAASQSSTAAASSKLLAPSSRRPGPGQLTLLRQQTPAEELSTITRSGRRCVQPLQHWKLEKAERDWDGTIKSVERVEEVEIQRPKQKRRGGTKSSRRQMESIEEDHDDDDDLEEWEVEGGSIIGPVQTYNPDDGTSSYDMHEEEIALGRLSITTKEVHGANFRYGKIVSMDFFGAGLIDLPVDGFKSKKQTRKMHMSFYVAEGKVTVIVGATQFTINKGGTWQVPRGNSYSIENAGSKAAKLFFAQANEKFIATDDEPSIAR